MKLYNSLTRTVEDFKPLVPGKATMYFCGPTVYHYAHIGNSRTYLLADLVFRLLKTNNYDVKFTMNITDVGHLVSDGDEGEDKMEKGARREGKSAWDIAEFYTQAFIEDYRNLNLTFPNAGEEHTDNPDDHFARATNHIKEQIALIQKLVDKGVTYVISDGVYFDTSKDPDYGELSSLDRSHLQATERVEQISEKRHPEDFALWKFSPKDEKRLMEWESPWGVGFPGWHIECSAMSMKYLGETIDIHGGGEDLHMTHHPNEIAQSETVTGKKFVNYWMHGAFILVEGQKMSKSLGNVYRLQDLIDKNYDPLALRYLYLTSHYRSQLDFKWDSLKAAQTTLERLRRVIQNAGIIGDADSSSPFFNGFFEALNDDLNTPKALAVMHEMLASDLSNDEKAAMLIAYDSVLGLRLSDEIGKTSVINTADENIKINGKSLAELIQTRDDARKNKDWKGSDNIRELLREHGYEIEDTKAGTVLKKSN